MTLSENNRSNEVWLLYVKKQKRMIASSESSAPHDEKYGFQAAE
jgi:hypothetical protein